MLNILFIDDSIADVELMCFHLKSEGLAFEWERVENEEILKEALSNKSYDVVICDYVLPGMLGIETIKKIKLFSKNVPIIVVSGQIGEEVAIETLKAGASDYLMKNNITRLKSAIERAIVEKETEAALTESKERMLSFMESATDGFLLFDEKLNVIDINKSGLKILNAKRHNIINKNIKEIPVLWENKVPDQITKVLNTGKADSIKKYKFEAILEKAFFEVKAFKVANGMGLILTDLTTIKTNEAKLRYSENKLRELTRHIEKVREEERTKIAMNMHDDLGQKLTAISIDIDFIKKNINSNPDEILQKANGISKLARELVQTVQQIATDMRPSIIDDLGLLTAIEWQLEEFGKKSSIKTNLIIENNQGQINKELAIVVYRILQEAFTNIVRHAKANEVKVIYNCKKDTLEIIVEDNGVGVKQEQIDHPDSFGIFSMAERARSCNGELNIRKASNVGTILKIYFPL